MDLTPVASSVSTASDVTFVPAGTIAATNVQSAIQEVASEAASALVAYYTSAEIDAFNFADASQVTAVQDSLDLHVADTSNPHAVTAAQAGAQPLDATLTALAGVTTAANKLIYATGVDTFTTADFTAFGRSLVDDADASAAKTTLGLVIGTNVQAQDAELAAIAGLTSAADKLPYFTGVGTAATADFTATARSLLDDASTSAMLTTLGAAPTANPTFTGTLNAAAGTFAGNLLPSASNTYDIGATGTRWKDGWFLGNLTASSNMNASGFFAGTSQAVSGTSHLFRDTGTIGWSSTTAYSGAVDVIEGRVSANVKYLRGDSATGVASTLQFQGKSSTTSGRATLDIATSWIVSTDASRTARADFSVYDTAARLAIRLEASGTVAKVGFFGASAVVQQSAGTTATDAASTLALANALRASLVNLGLIA